MAMINPTVKTILLCCPGRYQFYLANRLNEETNLLGIVIVGDTNDNEANGDKKSRLSRLLANKQYFLKPWTLVHHIYTRLRLRSYEVKSEALLHQNYPDFIKRQELPSVPVCRVDNVNSQESVDFVLANQPDMVCVNGTNLLREPMLAVNNTLQYGFVNLHTGLSPYSRGGNCNLFSLIEDKPEWVGATIHYIDQGIDSGDIICTIRPPIKLSDTYDFLESKVFIHGIDAFLKAIPFIVEGSAARVRQWQEGKLFLRRTGYKYHPKYRLRANIKIDQGLLVDYLKDKAVRDDGVKLINLPEECANHE